MKVANVINKESPKSSPWLVHYTILYRGREYHETLQGEFKDRYNINDAIAVDTFRDRNQNLSFMFKNII